MQNITDKDISAFEESTDYDYPCIELDRLYFDDDEFGLDVDGLFYI